MKIHIKLFRFCNAFELDFYILQSVLVCSYLIYFHFVRLPFLFQYFLAIKESSRKIQLEAQIGVLKLKAPKNSESWARSLIVMMHHTCTKTFKTQRQVWGALSQIPIQHVLVSILVMLLQLLAMTASFLSSIGNTIAATL